MKPKISNKEWAELTFKCWQLLGDNVPKENPLIVSGRTYEKLMEVDGLRKKPFKIGKWNNK